MSTPTKVSGDRVLHPRSVLITGANRGIGLEMVKQLIGLPEPPTYIFATCRSLPQAKALQEIANANPSVKILEFDVTNFDSVPQLVEQVASIVGDHGLNLLINNAGITSTPGLEETTVDAMLENYKVNVVGPFAVSKGLLPLLKKGASSCNEKNMDASKSAVINISSMTASMALLPETFFWSPLIAYRPAKAAVTMLTRVMALELAPAGVLAISIHPGWVETDMGGKEAPVKPAESVAGIFRVLGNATAEHTGLFIDFRGEAVPW